MHMLSSSLAFTYSIVARDPETGYLGVAVQTHQMTVGAVVPWLEPGAGGLATQALGNVSFGPMGLALLREGVPAQRVLDALVASDDGAHNRQVAVVDREGRAAAWTGANCIAYAGHQVGDGFSVQANMMTGPGVIEAMVSAYLGNSAGLEQRMMSALRAAEEQGGDIRGSQSAALKIVPGAPRAYQGADEWRPIFDLRVDEHSDPIDELERLVRLRRAQLISRKGSEALEQGDVEAALSQWQEARTLAPELEEMAFWQAVSLADSGHIDERVMDILIPMLGSDSRQEHWINLIDRLQQAELLEREETAAELQAAIRARLSG